MVELLSPAGTYEGFLAALSAGADAVYAGGQCFSARAYAGNLSDAELLSAIETTHILGKKLYLTLNTLCKEREFKDIYDYLAPLYERGLSGVIVQDIGIVRYLRKEFPLLPVHASTQMSICGIEGINYMRDLGVSRVVPARELTLEEIKNIRNMTDVELECFIHGAMCYSYSGQCLFSSFLGGRSGNRGRCAQPCRLPYDMGSGFKYPLSMKDMCTLDVLDKLIEAGISSFKIEGRMKKPEYTMTVTKIYRKYIDLYYSGKLDTDVSEFKKDYELLTRQYVRGEAGTGYYFKRNGRDLISMTASSYNADSEISGVTENGTGVKDEIKITPATISVDMDGYFKAGENAVLILSRGENSVTVTGGLCQKAKKAPMDAQRIIKQLSKTGGTCFCAGAVRIEAGEDVFISVGELNDLRRKGLEALAASLITPYLRKTGEGRPESVEDKDEGEGIAEHTPENNMDTVDHIGENVKVNGPEYTLCFETTEQLLAALNEKYAGYFKRIYVEASLLESAKDLILSGAPGAEIYAALPYVIRNDDMGTVENIIRQVNEDPDIMGVLVRSYEGLGLCNRLLDGDKPVVTDAGLYTLNSSACRHFLEGGAAVLTLPLELNIHEIRERGHLGESELLYYGRINMMLSAGCIEKTKGSCHRGKDGENKVSYITDRYKQKLPVIRDCEFCYNRVLNPKPLCLFSELDAIRNSKIGAVRFHFTIESGNEVSEILSRAFGDGPLKTADHTKGHFRKSVL